MQGRFSQIMNNGRINHRENPTEQNASPFKRAWAKLVSVFKAHALWFVTDVFVLMTTAGWWTTPFRWFRIYHYLIILLLFRWKRFDRFIPVRIIYFLLSLAFIDLSIFTFFPMHCISLPGFVISLISIPVCLFVMVKTTGWSSRGLAFSFIPALMLGVIIVGRANQPCTSEECEAVRAQPEIEVLADTTLNSNQRGFPRFMLHRKKHNDLIVTYRKPTPLSLDQFPINADRFDLKTKKLHPLRNVTGEPIGMHYHEPRDQVFIATINKGNHKHPKTLLVLDSRLKTTDVIDFLGGDDDDYTAHIMSFGDRLAIRAEGEGVYVVDPKTHDIRLKDTSNLQTNLKCRMFADAGFIKTGPARFMISGGVGPLIYIVFQGHGICNYDLNKMEFTQAYRAPISGAWDIALIPERNEVLATSIWRDKIWVVSADTLEYKRTLKIGPCVRPVAYDPQKKLGYTVECFSGNLVTFDIITGKILKKIYVGSNARKIYVSEELGTIILTECGILRLKDGGTLK